MIALDLRKLIDHLNLYLRRSLESAAGLCLSRGQYEVCVEHLLAVLLQDDDKDLAAILLKAGIDKGKLSREVNHALETLRAGNTGRPVFSPLLIELLSDAWLLASIELGLERLRSGALVAALRARPERFLAPEVADALEPLSAEAVRKQFADYVAASHEEEPASESTAGGEAGTVQDDSCLGRFTVDFVSQARAGKIDPVFCRDRGIEQIIDILGRRRKNNPIAVGEPGVGKTAVVEGLALKIAQGDVPDFLKGVDLRGLDLGLLQAGASVKGE
ncbi:MAG: Clp protease N-terminal domain-containing protein, partial [Geminicoccales bacterium]